MIEAYSPVLETRTRMLPRSGRENGGARRCEVHQNWAFSSFHLSAETFSPASGVALPRNTACQAWLLVSFHSPNQGVITSLVTASEACLLTTSAPPTHLS